MSQDVTKTLMLTNLAVMVGFVLCLLPVMGLSGAGLALMFVGLIAAYVLRSKYASTDSVAHSHAAGIIRTFWIMNGYLLIAIIIAGAVISSNAQTQALDVLLEALKTGAATPETVQVLIESFLAHNRSLFAMTLLGCLTPVVVYHVWTLGVGLRRLQSGQPWRVASK